MAKPRSSSRSLQAQAKSLFDELQIIDTSSADGRRRAYDRIDQDVRAYLAQAEGVPAQALTAEELRPKLAAPGASAARRSATCWPPASTPATAPTIACRTPARIGDTIAQLRGALGR